MKVWHDDVRPPPRDKLGWAWVRTNSEAIALLDTGMVEEISLDHDLGMENVDPDKKVYFGGSGDGVPAYLLAGESPDGSGYDLVEWMCKHERVPPRVTIHSWNPDGAKRMAARLNHHGHDCTIAPFQITREET